MYINFDVPKSHSIFMLSRFSTPGRALTAPRSARDGSGFRAAGTCWDGRDPGILMGPKKPPPQKKRADSGQL